MFEYKVIRAEASSTAMQENKLNEAAAQGWVLDRVAMSPSLSNYGNFVIFYMKREVQPL